jgi:virC1 protein
MSAIISFANQKGGVGKTTLCTTFANYLVEKGERLLILDCDNQNSISEKRQSDEQKYSTARFGYNVQRFDIADADKAAALMQQLKAVDGVIIIDTPGHLSQQGLLPLFIHSDIIVCPYFYDAASLQSTVTFLKFIEVLKSKVPLMQTQVLLVPNRYDKRIGKKDELELWDETDKAFACYGEVLPRIANKADMMRYNTLSLLDSQSIIVQPTYDRLYEILQQRTTSESSKST